jgi:hypothetical protein
VEAFSCSIKDPEVSYEELLLLEWVPSEFIRYVKLNVRMDNVGFAYREACAWYQVGTYKAGMT